MNKDTRQKIALLRYAIIAPVISGTYDEHGSIAGFFRDAANKVYKNTKGDDVKFCAGSIERWYYTYKKDGFDGLVPQRRSDVGRSRKMDDEIKDQIIYLKQQFPKIPATLIHQKLIESQVISKFDLSLSTVNRYVNEWKKNNKITTNKDIRRYERAHINEVWYGDSSVGPYMTIDGKKKRVYILALIDDASRFIVGVDIFFNDNFINLMSVMKSAISCYGKPNIFSFDNGTPYKNKQMELLVARIGTTVHYNAPYTPIQKAKIERWFSTLKSNWMSVLQMKEYQTLDQLRVSLKQYVESYNQKPHSSLQGAAPLNRFFEESVLIKRISEKQLEQSFLLEYERRVSADNVIVLNEVEYEVDYCYAKQKITLRYAPDLTTVYVVDKHTNELVPIQLLDKKANALIRREKVRLIGEDTDGLL